jgi:hypothetical protein
MALRRPETRLQEYWDWVAVALFLLITVDFLTSVFAAEAVGLEHEQNPIMEWVLSQSFLVIVGVHMAVLVLAASGFWLLFRLLERSAGTGKRALAFLIEIYLGLLVAAGLLVFANNLSVIVLGTNIL